MPARRGHRAAPTSKSRCPAGSCAGTKRTRADVEGWDGVREASHLMCLGVDDALKKHTTKQTHITRGKGGTRQLWRNATKRAFPRETFATDERASHIQRSQRIQTGKSLLVHRGEAGRSQTPAGGEGLMSGLASASQVCTCRG